jgi:hypothetical protein
MPTPLLLRIGLTRAVKAAAQMKKTSSPMKIHDIPLSRRFFFSGAAPTLVMSSVTVVTWGLV